ncbi:40S ribosomal protein S29 [Phytophthora nicotianae]|uniref:40S ribosomal protein S29 n=1 Tax=Phytophthora nicotianae TaxID=4792 RepID=A0A0W8BYX3_PHYNI|nr:40S ribosomal protein S29 [Phytophthora nicotianae]
MANLTYSHPRNYGKDSRHCRVCKTTRGLIRKYHLNMCRRCFRERATDIGFVKVNDSRYNTLQGDEQESYHVGLCLAVPVNMLLVGQPLAGRRGDARVISRAR